MKAFNFKQALQRKFFPIAFKQKQRSFRKLFVPTLKLTLWQGQNMEDSRANLFLAGTIVGAGLKPGRRVSFQSKFRRAMSSVQFHFLNFIVNSNTNLKNKCTEKNEFKKKATKPAGRSRNKTWPASQNVPASLLPLQPDSYGDLFLDFPYMLSTKRCVPKH